VTIISGALCFYFYIYPLFTAMRSQKQVLAPLFICGLFYVAAMLQLYPPSDSYWLHKYHPYFSMAVIGKHFARLESAILILPKPHIHFWNTNYINGLHIIDIMGLVWFIILMGFVIKTNRYRILFAMIFLSITAFNHYVYPQVSARHKGILFIAFMVVAWLYTITDKSYLTGKRALILTAIFSCQFLCGIFAYAMDYKYPFSSAKELSTYITNNHLEHENLMGITDYTASPVAGFLDRPIFYLERGHSATFMVWDNTRNLNITSGELEKQIEKSIKISPAKKPYLIANYDVPAKDTLKIFQLTKIKSCNKAIVSDENLSIYNVNYKNNKN
jgi:hypothetical protein